MYGEDIDNVVGKKVKSVRMDSDYAVLLFDDGSWQSFEVEGDCCSYSFFTDFVGVPNLINQTIKSVEEVSVDEDALGIPKIDESAYECIRDYGYRFSTDVGSATLVFRNSSNGYYGGWMVLTSAYVDSLEDCYTDIHI